MCDKLMRDLTFRRRQSRGGLAFSLYASTSRA
jgi:hypothetical protein